MNQQRETGQNISETVKCSYIINVQTSDSSFVEVKKQNDITTYITSDSLILDSVVLNSTMYSSENLK